MARKKTRSPSGRDASIVPGADGAHPGEEKRFIAAHKLLVPAFSLLLVAAALLISDHLSQTRAVEAAEANLTASALEQSATLGAIWEGQFDVLSTVAIGLAEYDTLDAHTAMARMERLSEESTFQYVTFALADGECRLENGEKANVSERYYFQQALNGQRAAERLENAKLGEEPMIVLAVPINKDGQVIGAVMGCYTEELLAGLITPEIYGGEAFSLICREDGFVSIGTNNSNYKSGAKNIFSAMQRIRLGKNVTAEEIKADIAAGRNGMVSYRAEGEKRYAIYVPLDTYAANGQRLVLFNIVPARLIDAAAERLTVANSLLFGLVLAASALTFCSYAYFLKKSAASISHERDLLRASEEQNRVAIAASGINLARYDLKTSVYYNSSDLLYSMGFGDEVRDVPEAFIAAGIVAPECVEEYRAFYEKLRSGEAEGMCCAFLVPDGSFRWFRVDVSYVCGADGKPSQAILLFRDVTEEREKEAVYAKWQQSIAQRDPESFTLFRCNLSKRASFDSTAGSLLKICFNPELTAFNERTREYASRFVHLDDFDAYAALLNSENLLASYYRGVRTAGLDYRERVTEGEYRWLRVTVEMTQYPDSSEIEAFLMYESINEAKEEALSVKERIDADPLTGVLNRSAFIEQFNALVSEQPDAQHALIMVDIDGFRRLNDNFGHAVGDQALVDIAATLRSAVLDSDFIGRLGGDEFLICMKNVPNQAVVERKALQIQSLMRKAYSVDIQLSASMGIAVYPQDGGDYNAVFHSVDLALYAAKANGRDSFAFYNGNAASSKGEGASAPKLGKRQAKMKRMLVVDNAWETLRLLETVFGDAYAIESCADETSAMTRLRRYGISLSVVLLNLAVPSMDSFRLLDRIQSIDGIRTIPVIALCRLDQRELGLRALRHGACDFILAPLNAELLQIRVDSAVSRAENERLRAQNTFLQTQNGDGARFRKIFEHTGTVVVEYDWVGGAFSYDPSISTHILGNYDERPLWQIFMSDMVADTMDVKAMQMLVHDLANDRAHSSATLDVMLKTPSKAKHWFTMNAFKRVDDLNMTNKIILTFLDVNEDVLASKKLHFQAEHDILTGLYNRSSFLRLVEETVRPRPANSYVLLCCDINDFRFINERFGREEGDKLLQYSAEKLLVNAEAMNGFTGRLSNDVYAMLLPNNPGILERTAEIVRDFFNDYPLKTRITGRAGAYIIADPAMSADSMLDLASTASDAIKGKFAAWLSVYEDSMSEKRLREKAITDRMEAALAEGQFDVYIQPQFHHATGQIVGAEALVRWIDPQNGVIPPSEFIPVFEKNGFITRLDAYVWERTAQYVSAWMARGNEPVPVSVNVSREDTNDPALCSKLLEIVQKYNVPIHLFRLEITESLFAEDPERLLAVVAQLHESGFLIEMDDFGSGYSSLNILKDVPVDILKLDMRFFSGSDSLGRGGMIINAVLRMSRWLGIPVVAEGVETQEQADFLLSIGCPTIQGYLYERPLPVPEFEAKFLDSFTLLGIPQNPVETYLEAHSFWNPVSADSQVFNKYIGPAVVFEYHNGEYEIVRMNRRFINTVHISETVMLPASGLIHFYEGDKPKFKKAVLEAIYSCKDVKVDVQSDLDDGTKPVFRVTMRVIAKSADRALLFASLDN